MSVAEPLHLVIELNSAWFKQIFDRTVIENENSTQKLTFTLDRFTSSKYLDDTNLKVVAYTKGSPFTELLSFDCASPWVIAYLSSQVTLFTSQSNKSYPEHVK